MAETRTRTGVALIIAVLLVSPGAGAKGLTKKQVDDLEQGDIVMIHLDDETKGYIGGNSYCLMDEDIGKAWNAIQDARVYAKIYPTTIESKTISKKGNKSVVKMVQGNKLVKATYYLNYKANPSKYKLSWKLNTSMPHDIADSRGYFQFTTYKDGRLLMKMSTVLDLGNAMVEKLFGEKIAAGLLRLPKKFARFLKKPESSKYIPKPEDTGSQE